MLILRYRVDVLILNLVVSFDLNIYYLNTNLTKTLYGIKICACDVLEYMRDFSRQELPTIFTWGASHSESHPSYTHGVSMGHSYSYSRLGALILIYYYY